MGEIENTGALQSEQQRVAAWDRLTELRQQLYGAATWQMLAAADLQPGDQVLDIAAGFPYREVHLDDARGGTHSPPAPS